MTTFFTADPHFGSATSLRLGKRADLFYNPAQADHALISQINDTVGRNDILHIVGDFSYTDPGKWRREINCKHIFFTFGNHDRYEATVRAFGSVRHLRRHKYKGGRVYLCHYPMVQWPGSHRGTFHLYGHTHAGIERQMDKLFPGRRSMDCGVDNAYRLLGDYRPFSLGDVLDILGPKPGHHPGGDSNAK